MKCRRIDHQESKIKSICTSSDCDLDPFCCSRCVDDEKLHDSHRRSCIAFDADWKKKLEKLFNTQTNLINKLKELIELIEVLNFSLC